MKNNVSLAKIVANSTEKTWTQAYSTLNLYVVISIEDIEFESDKSEPIASYGKTVLEKLQREFFAIENKRLPEIKKAVQKTIETIDPSIKYSLILANIVKGALYVITAGYGLVLIKRGKKTGIVAQGEEDKVYAFSGLIENNDMIVLQTEGFTNKIPPEKLSRLLGEKQAEDAAENIAPVIHGSPKGTEAAIIIQYQNYPILTGSDYQEQEDNQEVIIPKRINVVLPPVIKLGIKNILAKILKIPFLSRKKALILVAIFLLIILLAGVIFLDKKRGEQKRMLQLSENVISLAQNKYSQAQTFINLNKNLALQNLTEAKNILNKEKGKFTPGSSERKNIDALLAKIDGQIHSFESGNSIKNQKTLFQTESSLEIKQIGQITLKGNDFTVTDKSLGNIVILSKDDGKILNSAKTSVKNPMFITANAIEIYLLSDNGVYKIGKKDEKSQKIIDLSSGNNHAGIDTYLGNIYLLNSKDKNIEKYSPAAYKKSEYLQGSVKLSQPPVSMAIDGSVWILQSDGKIVKFTKGKEESFEFKNLPITISKNSILYTEADFKNLYVLDKDTQKIIVIAKTGEYQDQYNLSSLEKITTFAVDETGKKIFAASASKIYSFEL